MFGYIHFSANRCLFWNFFLLTSLHLELCFLVQGSVLLIGEYISYHVLFVSCMMMHCKQCNNFLFLFCRYRRPHWITLSRKSFGFLICPEEKDNCKWISVAILCILLWWFHLIILLLSFADVQLPSSFWRCNWWNEVAIRTYKENLAILRISSICLYIICLHFLYIFLLKNLI